MILQGKFSSVFTPNSLHALNNGHSSGSSANLHKSNLYLVDDSFPSAKTVSIEYKCDKNYVGYVFPVCSMTFSVPSYKVANFFFLP